MLLLGLTTDRTLIGYRQCENMTEDKIIENIQSRTDAKLRYASVHLDEMKSKGIVGGDDFDRAHQESFLFHILGVKESFLCELNKYYKLEISDSEISPGNLRKALDKVGLKSPELAELYNLENNKESWLFHAKSIRDHSTHVSSVPRHFHLGGENHQKVFISNPKTGKIIDRHINDEFTDWLTKMKVLISRLRATGLEFHSTHWR